MWKQGGQSSALNRAQALLAAKKKSRGDSQATQGTGDGLISSRPAPPETNTVFSDLSDLSSSSSAPECGANPTTCTAAEKNRDTVDTRHQDSLQGGGSRFLKKASPPVTNSSQSPASISHTQQKPGPRYASSSHHGSQTAVLSRLAQIESRIHGRLQPQEQAREAAQNIIPTLSTPQKTVTQTPEASTLLTSAESRNDQSQTVKRFLKNTATTSELSVGSGAGVRARTSAAAAAAVSLGGLETKSVKVDYGVSLESDEEDMRKLLGDSLDSTDNSFFRPEKSPSVTKTEKMLSQRTHSTPPSAAAQHLSSNAAPVRSPASPSHRSSPFRFTGQAQAHFSPSAVSPSPSPACVSPSLSGRLSTPRRVGSPRHSVCSVSGRREVLSLEELFPVQPAPGELPDVMSVGWSEDFKLNVMTLDELVPVTEKKPREQRKEHNQSVSGSPERHEKRHMKVEQQQHKDEDEEEMVDYQSDFESEGRSEQNYSASQVSDQLMGNGDEDEAALEVRDEASVSGASRGRTEDDYSNISSDPSRSCKSQTSDYSDTSESHSRSSRDSRSPVSPVSHASSHRSGKRPAARRAATDAAVQTQPAAYTWPTDATTFVPVLGLTYRSPPSVAAHYLDAETVQAVSTYNPAAFLLNEMLKHQLTTTKQFIESSRRLHASLVRSLEPPNYRYTTLEETKEYIRVRRPSKLTMEEALKEVKQETTLCHCTVCD